VLLLSDKRNVDKTGIDSINPLPARPCSWLVPVPYPEKILALMICHLYWWSRKFAALKWTSQEALTNHSPVELIRSIRLKRAATLLKQKYGNISEVAYVTGFNTPSYFSECFQKQFGLSPSEYISKDWQ